jgi:hypothetical protein
MRTTMVGKKGLTNQAFSEKEPRIRTAMAVFRDGIAFDVLQRKQVSLGGEVDVDSSVGVLEGT